MLRIDGSAPASPRKRGEAKIARYPMNTQFLIQLIVNGLVVGTLYGVVAMSFVLIYKATQVVNFAQGELLLVGAWYVPAGWHEKAVYIAAWFVCLYGASATPERIRVACAMQKTE